MKVGEDGCTRHGLKTIFDHLSSPVSYEFSPRLFWSKMHHMYFALVFFIINAVRSTNETLPAELRALNLSSGSQIGLTPESTQRWSSYYAPSFVTAVKPAMDSDVAKIVMFIL